MFIFNIVFVIWRYRIKSNQIKSLTLELGLLLANVYLLFGIIAECEIVKSRYQSI